MARRRSYRHVTPAGYVRVFAPCHPMAGKSGWVYEHRMVAYNFGILAGPDDRRHVHHRNADKSDNHPENLEAISASEHGRRHVVVDWERGRSLYEAGMNTVEVAGVLGVNASTVWRALDRRGVRMRSNSEANLVALSEGEKLLIEELGRAGVPARAIARLTGIGVGVVRRRLGRRDAAKKGRLSHREKEAILARLSGHLRLDDVKAELGLNGERARNQSKAGTP